uniref:Phosphoacetylglucosamine mutase AMG1 domain-containing protein n=1 Tax=Heterorhabditis bacteriophora TaxID=37862 RepID=A0A1I7WED3_HETBA
MSLFIKIPDILVPMIKLCRPGVDSLNFSYYIIGFTFRRDSYFLKYLHHAALQFDRVGILFIKHLFYYLITLFRVACKNPAARRLQLISRVINEVVGDAMADLLAVELILRWYGWNITDWEQQLYCDAPSVQLKVPVCIFSNNLIFLKNILHHFIYLLFSF